MNGEVGCSAVVSCDVTTPADESRSCSCNKNELNCEVGECEHSQALCKPPDAAVSFTERLSDCETCAAAQEHARHLSTDRHHCTAEVQSRSQKLTNGTIDDSCDVTAERPDDHGAVEVNDKHSSDDAASETAEPCTSSGGTSCVSESTRWNILDAAETFASIIGREIAASFDLKEGELSPAESQGNADVSTACIAGQSNSTRTLQAGLKLLHVDRKWDSEKEPALDTVEVARRVRDILTANNVGQRQFARYVLGLSQGTVSELLAKPKPWNRLTEKGKESYRRMSQWASDHLGVLTLKDHLNSVALKANLPSPKGSYS